MREEKNIIKNYKNAKKLTLIAIHQYLQGNSYTITHPKQYDSQGYVISSMQLDMGYHGKTGKDRAGKLKKYLEQVDDNDHAALLALFIVIFKGQSSRLAGLIAKEWVSGIDGRYESRVFSQLALTEIGAKHAAHLSVENGHPDSSVTTYWEVLSRQAMGVMLEQAFAQLEFKNKCIIGLTIKPLKKWLDNGDCKINLALLPKSHAFDKAFIQAALVSLLSRSKLPIELLEFIAVFLMRFDVIRILECNRSAYYNVTTVINSRRKKQPDEDRYGLFGNLKLLTVRNSCQALVNRK